MRAVRHAGAGQDTPCLRILRRFVPEQASTPQLCNQRESGNFLTVRNLTEPEKRFDQLAFAAGSVATAAC